MAELDPSIILAGKPIQLANPMDLQAKALQLSQLGLQNQSAQQEFQDNQTLRSLYQKYAKPDGTIDQAGLISGMYGAGLGKQGIAMQQQQLANRKTQGEIGLTDAQTGKATAETSSDQFGLQQKKLGVVSDKLGALIGTPDLDHTHVIGAISDLVTQGLIDPQTGAQMARQVPGNPAQLRPWLISKAQETQTYSQQLDNQIKQAPQVEKLDTGGAINLAQRDPLTGQVSLGQNVGKTATPGEQLTAQTAAQRLKFDQTKQMTGGLTQDALENAYQQFKVSGETPNSGRGGAAQQGAYANYFAKRAQEDGDTGAAQAVRRLQFHASAGVLKDFESGQTSKDITALNTSIKHVGVLEPLIDSLGNTDSTFVNKVKNAVKDQFGSTAPNDFNGVRDFVTGEISKAALPGGGGEDERNAIKDAAASSKTPAQLKSIVGRWEELLAGKTDAIRNKWDVGTSGNQGSFDKFLLPETKAALGRHGLGQPTPDAAPTAPGARPPLDSIFK